MDDSPKHNFELPPEQQTIRDKRLHPSGAFVEFPIEEVETSIPERFEKIVGLFPERIAVKTRDRALTFEELNRAANRIAHAIWQRSAKIEEPIALLLEQGVDVIAALLGTVKTGNIYVPLDPAFPLLRNQAVLLDASAKLIITNQSNFSLAKVLAGNKIAVINIDELPAFLGCANPPLRITADTLAYVLYTSGSTGTPKGVVQNHRNVLHLIMRYTNRAHITPEDRIALLRSFNVHQGTLMSFAALLNGAAILPFDTKREGLQELAHWLAREEITLCRMGPTLLRHLTAILRDEDHYPRLREISFSGEPLYWSDVARSKKHFPANCALVNSFGSTEVSSCCEFTIATDPAIENGVVPCGYPTNEMEILVLQDDGRESPPGDVGEIAVRSRFLALEYWRNPEFTGAKFLPSPTGKEERIYLTGDQGRLSPDGRLEHLGRKDFQVKNRGYRVELSEIESALLALDNIREAAVVGREDPVGEKHLVAYVVSERQPAPSTTMMRRALQNSLPDYMSPAVFVVLDEMPLTPNGKIDKRALPAPTGSRPDLDRAYVAPRNSIEEKLAAIWTEVLAIEGVGIYDNFLDLGGHSLAATRVVSRIYAAYQIELPLAQFVKTPTIAALADYLEKVGPSSVKYEPIHPVLQDGHLPLSFSQQRLWFLNQLAPDNPVYNEPKALRLKGSLDIALLKKALDAIVARHDVLRSTFTSVDGKPMVVVTAKRSVEMPLVDLSAMHTVQREREVRDLLTEDMQRPFNLGQDLLLRATLFRMDENDHVLLLVVHHIASDGWSSTILFREFSLLYSAFMTDGPSPLSNLPIQYADFAAWQRRRLQGAVLETQLSYWRKQLESAPAILNLPTDRPRPAAQSFRGRTLWAELPKELTQRLKALSREEQASLFMTLLAGFQTFLQRYTGQNDLLVGTPVANRIRVELENLLGCFVNTLVLRLNVSDDPSFRELLGRAREVCVGAYSHQDLPFEKIVEELQLQRDLSRSPLVQVMFQLKNVPERSVSLPAIEFDEMEFDHEVAKFDLTLSMVDRGSTIAVTMVYDTDLFDRGTMERMLGHFQTLLEGIVTNPEQRISELPLLTESERHQLLVEWNDTKSDYPGDKCIHELFEQQAEESPDALAVVFEDQQLSYRQLNERANRLARYLQRQGVGADVRVGICMARSLDLIVGLLGIVKSGGAYVPLDINYPPERLEFVLADAQVAVLLTQEDLFEAEGLRKAGSERQFPRFDPRTQRVCLDRDWQLIHKEIAANLENTTGVDNLAYVIYTSGSTGQPKGVAIEHRNTVAFLSWAHGAFTKEELSGVLASTSICFDLSVFEIFAPLTCGGTVILAENALAITTISTRSKVSLLNTVPSAINELLRLEAVPASVRVINLAGEPLRTDLVRRIYESTEVGKVHDLYGPSECTTYSTWTCRTADGPQTIGRPIGNTQVYILDGERHALPIGVVGEIYIGGDGVARGYLNRPELTAERFIHHSFDGGPDRRLYRTGDLARYLPDGNIEFLGRIDDQVKIRGYRIELGEIEAVLGQHGAIQQVVVLAREDNPGDRRLVAYAVVSPGMSASASDLRSYLQQKLPEYMVPATFMFLASLPLTGNGKVDRRALPAPEQTRPDLNEAYAAPRTADEKLLAGIWSEVLKVDKVGIYDNFFALGGHSLLATQIVSRIRSGCSVELPLRDIFGSPTIHALAQRLQAQREKNSSTQGTQIPRVARNRYRVQ